MISTHRLLPFLALALASGMLSGSTDEYLASRLDMFRITEGLSDQHSLKLSRTHLDDQVPVHRLQQFHRGLKVWGAATNVREHNGALSVIAKRLFNDIQIGLEPTLSTTEIRKCVDIELQREQLGKSHPKILNRTDSDPVAVDLDTTAHPVKIHHLSEPELELVIFPVEEQRVRPEAAHKPYQQLNAEDVEYLVTGYRLAYHVATETEVHGFPEGMNYLVDAHTGEIIQKWNLVQRGVVAGTAQTKYNGNVTLYTNQNGSNFEAKDPIYCNNLIIPTMTSSTPYTDADNTWGNNGNYLDGTAEAKQTGAAEALYALQRAGQMHKGVWNRNGASGAGIALKVVWGQYKASDTSINSKGNLMIVGYEDAYCKDMTTLDIVGHEYGHNFDYWYPRLCDDKSGEAGGMAEAHADIMGLLTEVYGKYTPNDPNNPATTFPEAALNDPNTWILGEEIAKMSLNGGKGLRFFIKPSWNTDGGSIDAWRSDMASVEVHAAAGPIDRMFYYLAVGAPSSSSHDGFTSYLPKGSIGVGLHKAARIWVKAMTSGQLATYSKHTNARTACINAATSLYGTNSPEALAVMNAFAGVNVGQPAGSVSISPSSTTLYSNVSQLFKASLLGTTSTAVTWTCTGGYVDSTGNFKAPVVTSTKTYKVRATSVADTSKYAEATVTVNPSVVSTYTEVEPNNSLSAANSVPDTSTKITGTMSANTDLDFFKVNVAPGRTLTVNMTGPTGADFDLFLLNSAGTVLKRSENSTCTESVNYQNSGTSTATYYIKVTRDSGSSSTNTYNLTLLR